MRPLLLAFPITLLLVSCSAPSQQRVQAPDSQPSVSNGSARSLTPLTRETSPIAADSAPPATAPASKVFIGIEITDGIFIANLSTANTETRPAWVVVDRRHLHPVLYVETVVPGSPAIDAGLMAGDQIDAVDGKAVECDDHLRGQTEQFLAYIRHLSPGTVLKLRVLRGSEPPREVEVKLAAGR